VIDVSYSRTLFVFTTTGVSRVKITVSQSPNVTYFETLCRSIRKNGRVGHNAHSGFSQTLPVSLQSHGKGKGVLRQAEVAQGVPVS
jgi:hypothetical protein